MMRAVKSPVALLLAPSGCELLAGGTLSGSDWPVVPGRHSPCLLPEPVGTEPVGETEGSFQHLSCALACKYEACLIFHDFSPDTLFH